MDEETEKSFLELVIKDNNQIKAVGHELMFAALRVLTEYDGMHRLWLAVSQWAKLMADERIRVYNNTENKDIEEQGDER